MKEIKIEFDKFHMTEKIMFTTKVYHEIPNFVGRNMHKGDIPLMIRYYLENL